ncbi:hypothetical protein LTR56_000302 [Elasticomyces elasticus]|nr:hypothetical protein LTR56_000302 [Elasticomyces elasticus]KAK3667003.1 hypothetical protein LTR22_002228 [Elasticomyces elasticus]KAK4933294.1 hypothetical protein LTR49_000288 [Elasticomyces elasticus]KAK5757352.1 hypothetical protein LTS12_012564 [Elasticomyces elasticus]
MATAVALATFELLEAFLLGLDFHDLLAARAVSKEWHNLIMQSLPLKRSLFLAPTSHEPFGIDLRVSTVSRKFKGPVLTRQPSNTNPLFPESRRRNYFPDIERAIVKRDLNVTHWPGGPSVGCTLSTYLFTWPITNLAVTECQLYREMFLTQPPCTAGTIIIRGQPTYDGSRRVSAVAMRVSDGFRLGTIVDMVEDMLRDHDDTRTGYEVHVKFETCF